MPFCLYVVRLVIYVMQCNASLKPLSSLTMQCSLSLDIYIPTLLKSLLKHDPAVVLAIHSIIDLHAHAHLRHEWVVDVEA